MAITAATKTAIKFTIERDAILTGLQLVAGVVERRQTLPILSNVLFELEPRQLRLTGTDLEVELSAVIALPDCEQAGRVAIPARKLLDICRSLPEKALLQFTVDQDNVTVKAGASRFNLACLSADEFPRSAALREPCRFVLAASALSGLFSAVHFAMAQQDVRYFLNGSLLHVESKTVTVVATDGHRLALARRPIAVDISGDKKVIVPRKAVMELLRLLNDVTEDVQISIDNNHISFNTSSFSMVSKLIDGRFPDYTRVIPRHNDKVLTLDRDVFKQALSRVAILANEKNRGVRLEIAPQQLTLSANNPEREQAEETLTVNYDGEPINIGFNVSYLLDVLNIVPAGDNHWLLANSSGSVLLENNTAEQDGSYVVMPMRL